MGRPHVLYFVAYILSSERLLCMIACTHISAYIFAKLCFKKCAEVITYLCIFLDTCYDIVFCITIFFGYLNTGTEIQNLEMRLQLDNLKSEINNLKMEKDILKSQLTKFEMEVRLEMRMLSERVAQTDPVTNLLSKVSTEIRKDIASLKSRQDQLFHKQDQIQCTLAGETPPAHYDTFQSPTNSSLLAWSSTQIPTSINFPASTPHPAPVTIQTKAPVDTTQQPTIMHSTTESCFMYGIDELSSILEETGSYQSSLATMKSPTPTEPAIPLPGKPGYPYMPEPTHQYALSRQQSSEECVIVSQSQSQIELAKGDPQLSSLSCQKESPTVATVNFSEAGLEPPFKRSRLDIRPEDTGDSSTLKDPQTVLKKYPEYANIADMGKLACVLARQCFFGDDVLKNSTVHGKSPRFQALNPQKLSALMATIHELPEFRDKSRQEFSLLCTPRIH